MNRTVAMLKLSLMLPSALVAAVECEFTHWQNYKNEKLLINESKSAFIFATQHKAIDADGAPNAYHPENIGLDNYLNAGYPDSDWWPSVLVEDPNHPNKPYVQPDGEFKGYFISKTSLFDKQKSKLDPSRYVDATHFPYLVYPGKFYSKKGTGRLGDIGIAINLETNDIQSFVVTDVGPSNASLGEMSMALAEGLGGKNVNPRNGAGAPRGKILYVLFPYSSKQHPWPLTTEQIEQIGDELLESIGGQEQTLSCSTLLEK